VARRKSLKNGKHLVDLLESAMLPAIRLLATLDKFTFLPLPATALSDAEARAQLIAALPEADPIALVAADQEAMCVLDLTRFRTGYLLVCADDALDLAAHPQAHRPASAEFSRSAGALRGMCCTRGCASRRPFVERNPAWNSFTPANATTPVAAMPA